MPYGYEEGHRGAGADEDLVRGLLGRGLLAAGWDCRAGVFWLELMGKGLLATRWAGDCWLLAALDSWGRDCWLLGGNAGLGAAGWSFSGGDYWLLGGEGVAGEGLWRVSVGGSRDRSVGLVSRMGEKKACTLRGLGDGQWQGCDSHFLPPW